MIFVVRHDAGGDVLLTFEGMNEKEIGRMYTKDNISFETITKADYEDRVSEVPPPQPQTKPTLEERVAALEAKASK